MARQLCRRNSGSSVPRLGGMSRAASAGGQVRRLAVAAKQMQCAANNFCCISLRFVNYIREVTSISR